MLDALSWWLVRRPATETCGTGARILDLPGHAANGPGQSQSSLPSERVSVTQDPLSFYVGSCCPQRERRFVERPRALEVGDFVVLRFA